MILLPIISPVLFWQATLPRKKGLYDAAFYRTSDRKLRIMLIQAATVSTKAAQALGYSETYTENYQSDHFKFASTNNPNTLEQYGSSAIPATKIDLAGAYPITKTYFEYNEEDGLYYRFQGMQKGDQKHMDGANNKQLAFKNVLVQFAYYETRDAKGLSVFPVPRRHQRRLLLHKRQGHPCNLEKNQRLRTDQVL